MACVSGAECVALREVFFREKREQTMTRVPLIASLILCLCLSFFEASIQAAETKLDPSAKETCIKACKKCEDGCRALSM